MGNNNGPIKARMFVGGLKSLFIDMAETLDEVFDAHRLVATKLLHHPGVADREINAMKTKYSTLNG